MATVTKETWHGTYNGYSNHGCRCNECKAANAAYLKTYRAQRFDGTKCTTKRCQNPPAKNAGNGKCFACNHEETSA